MFLSFAQDLFEKIMSIEIDWALFWSVTLYLLEGLMTTARLFFMTLLFALPLGLVFSFFSKSKIAPLRWLMRTIIWIIRGTPLLLQLIVIYYGPGLLFGLDLLPRFSAALLAFVINYSCYFSEIFRGGIEGVPRGQQEAGAVLGMTKTQTFFRVTLLQVIKRIVPPMSNEIITLVKDTSLARVIAVYEIIFHAESYIKGAGIIWPLLYTAVFYLVFNGILTILFNRLERKLDYFRV